MTEEDFRKDPAFRDALGALMQDNILQTALAIVKSRNELVPLPLGITGIDSARAFTENQTRALFVHEMFELTKTLPDPQEPRMQENFGTEHVVSEFDQPAEKV